MSERVRCVRERGVCDSLTLLYTVHVMNVALIVAEPLAVL